MKKTKLSLLLALALALSAPQIVQTASAAESSERPANPYAA